MQITEVAIKKLIDYAAAEGFDPTVRVKIIGSGCAGLSGDLLLEEVITDDDITFERDGIKVVIDQISQHYLDNVVIDYIDGEFASGFKFLFTDEQIKSCG